MCRIISNIEGLCPSAHIRIEGNLSMSAALPKEKKKTVLKRVMIKPDEKEVCTH